MSTRRSNPTRVAATVAEVSRSSSGSRSSLVRCPRCQSEVRRVLFAPNFVVKGSPVSQTDKQIKEYEKEGKWSHAAELADKAAEKTKREDLKTRALEDYKKAGYNFDKYDT